MEASAFYNFNGNNSNSHVLNLDLPFNFQGNKYNSNHKNCDSSRAKKQATGTADYNSYYYQQNLWDARMGNNGNLNNYNLNYQSSSGLSTYLSQPFVPYSNSNTTSLPVSLTPALLLPHQTTTATAAAAASFRGQPAISSNPQQQQPSCIRNNNLNSHNVNETCSSSITPSFSQPHCQNQLEYLQWLQQVQRDQQQQQQHDVGSCIKRPWWLWIIACVDILSAVWYTALVVHSIFTKPISDPDAYIWQFFISFLAILARLLMGVGLFNGLKGDDDSSALWYCKIWVACQLIFLAWSCVEIIWTALFQATITRNKNYFVEHTLAVFGIFIYRMISFFLVRRFIAKLKKSEIMSLGDAIAYAEEQRRTEEEDERNRFGTGESSFCGPSVALIMSL